MEHHLYNRLQLIETCKRLMGLPGHEPIKDASLVHHDLIDHHLAILQNTRQTVTTIMGVAVRNMYHDVRRKTNNVSVALDDDIYTSGFQNYKPYTLFINGMPYSRHHSYPSNHMADYFGFSARELELFEQVCYNDTMDVDNQIKTLEEMFKVTDRSLTLSQVTF